MKRNLVLIITLILLFTSQLSFAGGKGSSGWIVFRKAVSPKPVMSSIFMGPELQATISAPSVLGKINKREIFTLVEFGFSNDRFVGLSYALPFKNKSSFLFSVFNYDVGKMDLAWIENGLLQERTVKAMSDILATVCYGKKYSEKVSAGAAIKFARSEIAETASAYAYAGDLNVSYIVNKEIAVLASCQNIGTATAFLEKADSLPTNILVEGGYLHHLGKEYFVIGDGKIIYILKETRFDPILSVELKKGRAGVFVTYKFEVDEGMSDIGFSMLIKNVNFSYSYTPTAWLNSIHKLSISYRFDKRK